MWTYQSTGFDRISDSKNGPEAAYWTVEISFPTNDIIDKLKFKEGMTGRVNEVNLLLSNHLHEPRGKKLVWTSSRISIWKHSIIQCFEYYVSCLHIRGIQDNVCNWNKIYRGKLFDNIDHVSRLKHTTRIPLGLGHAPLQLFQTLVIQKLLWKFSSQWIVFQMASPTLNTQRLL